jgi:Replication protein A C terminal
MLRPTTKIT